MRKKILLVDDDPGIHLLVNQILTNAGYVIVSATSGEQGLMLALSERPDLIILDVIMPGLKGRDLCARIKAYPILEPIPIIFLTGKDSDDDIAAEHKVGGIAHLTKPVDAEKLLAVIKGIVGHESR